MPRKVYIYIDISLSLSLLRLFYFLFQLRQIIWIPVWEMGIAVSPRPPARIHWTYSSSVSTIWMSSYTWNTDADYQTESNYLTLIFREGVWRGSPETRKGRFGAKARLHQEYDINESFMMVKWNHWIRNNAGCLFWCRTMQLFVENRCKGWTSTPPCMHWCKLTFIEDVFHNQEISIWFSLLAPSHSATETSVIVHILQVFFHNCNDIFKSFRYWRQLSWKLLQFQL